METFANVAGKPYEQRGLFLKCNALQGGGQFQCTPINEALKLTQLPKYLGYSRVAIPFAIALTGVATICAILGNPAFTCMGASKKTMTMITSITFLLAGLLALVSYSWYTNAAMKNYVTFQGKIDKGGANPLNKVSVWDLGWAMWLGFVNSIFTIGGSVYAMMTAMGMEEKKEDYRYHGANRGREMDYI